MKEQFWFILLVAIGNCCVKGWNLEKESLLDSYINNDYLPKTRAPGLVSIVENNQIVLAKGYGYRNVEKELKADGDTLMSIASITKSFVGTLVVKILHEKFPQLGEKALDTPLNSLLPSASKVTFSDRYRTESMTFRDLLSHRSCLVSPDFDLAYVSIPSIAEQRYRLRFQKESCAFRNGFEYNNALYAHAGDLIGVIAGEPIEQLLMKFMKEIGMFESYLIDRDGNFENLPHMSQAYFIRENKTQIFSPKLLTRIHTMIAAGGILSSAKDMAKYMLFHLNFGKVGEKEVIPKKVMKRIYKVSSILSDLNGKNSSETDRVGGNYGYSLGFANLLMDGWNAIEHGGFWPTFKSEIFIIPALKSGIFISCNGPGALNPEFNLTDTELGLIIFDILRGKVTNVSEINLKFIQSTPSTEGDVEETPPKKNMTYLGPRFNNTKKNEDLVGLYGHPTNGDLIISYNSSQDILQMKFGEFGTGNLIEVSPLKYQIHWTGDIMDLFYASGINAKLVVDFIDFGYENKAVILGIDENDPVLCEFTKGASIDTFPAVPWDLSSSSARCFSFWCVSFNLFFFFVIINYTCAF